jgi:hypothetical protein
MLTERIKTREIEYTVMNTAPRQGELECEAVHARLGEKYTYQLNGAIVLLLPSSENFY